MSGASRVPGEPQQSVDEAAGDAFGWVERAMELIQWQEEYSVGVPEFDEQHKGLVMLINRLTEAGHRPERITSALDALDRYAKEHFRAEEALMTSRHYEQLDEHRKQHQAFEEWLQAVKVVYNFSTSPDFFADTVNTFLRHWLINHILKTDMAYKPVLAKRS
jgi:hemerythrin-like metal-binding protein